MERFVEVEPGIRLIGGTPVQLPLLDHPRRLSTAHRGAELAPVTTPTLVIDASEDPINPPPHAAHIAAAINGADLPDIPTLGHAIGSDVGPALAGAILGPTAHHTARH